MDVIQSSPSHLDEETSLVKFMHPHGPHRMNILESPVNMETTGG